MEYSFAEVEKYAEQIGLALFAQFAFVKSIHDL
jgi:hypothetical protein